MALTKPMLAALIANQANISKAEAGRLLDFLGQAIVSELETADRFILPGVGILKRVKRSARVSPNPATGGTVNVPAKLGIKFKMSKELDEAWNGKK